LATRWADTLDATAPAQVGDSGCRVDEGIAAKHGLAKLRQPPEKIRNRRESSAIIPPGTISTGRVAACPGSCPTGLLQPATRQLAASDWRQRCCPCATGEVTLNLAGRQPIEDLHGKPIEDH